MSAGIGFAVGALLGAVCWLALRPSLQGGAFLRENYRGHRLPTAGGVVLPAALLVGQAGFTLLVRADVGVEQVEVFLRDQTGTALVVLVVALGFGLLGLFDDLGGDGDRRGFRGHLTSIARGAPTTGAVKLVGGAAIGVTAMSTIGSSAVEVLRDGAVVALAANVGNLFDRAPGRVTKVSLVCFGVLMAVTAASPVLTAVAVLVGAATATLVPDLREQMMLGDTGANVLGAVLGVGAALATTGTGRWMVLAALVAVNALAEVISFSRVIDAVPPLRMLDRLGRLEVPR